MINCRHSAQFRWQVQEGVGKVTGDTKTEVKGVMDQAAGAVQDAYGKTVDAAMEGAQTVKEAAVEGHDAVRKFVEDNPHLPQPCAQNRPFDRLRGPSPTATRLLVRLNFIINVRKSDMDNRTQAQGFDRAMGEAKKQASNVADAANTAARKTASSLETAARDLIENQPYTALAIGVGFGWLLGRLHRPF
jgi:uncharacterized protein YjbJ (UPF0337 family)